MYILDTANADTGACDIVSKDSIDCTNDFSANFVCDDNYDAIVNLDTTAVDTAIGYYILVTSKSLTIQTR